MMHMQIVAYKAFVTTSAEMKVERHINNKVVKQSSQPLNLLDFDGTAQQTGLHASPSVSDKRV